MYSEHSFKVIILHRDKLHCYKVAVADLFSCLLLVCDSAVEEDFSGESSRPNDAEIH